MTIDDRVLGHAVDHGGHGDPHAEHASANGEHVPTGEHGGHGGHGGHSDHAGMFRRRFWWSLLLSVPIVATAHMIQDWFGYHLAFPGEGLVGPVLGTIVFLYGGWPFLTGGVAEARSRQPGMMLLIAMAITVAFGASAATSLGLFDLDFWWELAALITIMLLGHWQEMKAIGQARGALAALAELLPDEAERFDPDGRLEKVSVEELAEGDVVLVRSGARVPADGEIVEGQAELDESMVTGESRPVAKSPGEAVVAGTVATDAGPRRLCRSPSGHSRSLRPQRRHRAGPGRSDHDRDPPRGATPLAAGGPKEPRPHRHDGGRSVVGVLRRHRPGGVGADAGGHADRRRQRESRCHSHALLPARRLLPARGASQGLLAHRLASSAGQIAGPALAGLLAAFLGWRAPFVLFAVPTVLLVVAALRLREPVRGVHERRAVGADEATAQSPESPEGPLMTMRVLARVRTVRRIWVAAPFLGIALFGVPSLLSLVYDDVFGSASPNEGSWLQVWSRFRSWA